MQLLLTLLLAPPGALNAADLEAGIARAIEGGAAKALAALENGVIDVRRLGAACDGVDTGTDTPAFRSALARAALRPYGAVIRVPAGRCVLSEGLTAALHHNQALSIEGAGADVSVTLSSANAWLRSGTASLSGALFHMTGLSLATEGRNAVTISNAAAINSGSRQVQLENIVVRGDGVGSSFQNGIVLDKSAWPWSRTATPRVLQDGQHGCWDRHVLGCRVQRRRPQRHADGNQVCADVLSAGRMFAGHHNRQQLLRRRAGRHRGEQPPA